MITTDTTIFLSKFYVYLLEVNFFLIILALILNYKYIKNLFEAIPKKQTVLLAVISISATLWGLLNPKVHRIYYDEDIYCSIAQCIAHHKRAVMCNEGYYENKELTVIAEEYNKQPAAYPYLLSVIFRIFGTNELYAFIYNNLIYGLMAIVIFLIVYLLFNDIFAGLVASLCYVLIPVNMQWFNTCAVEPSAALFAGLSILTALIYIRNKKLVNLFLCTFITAFALSFRPESFLIAFAIGLIFLLKDMGVLRRKELYVCVFLMLILSAGIRVHLSITQHQSWGARGAKFGMEYFAKNFNTNGFFYLNNKMFPLLFTIFAIIGLIFYNFKNTIKEKMILLCWLLPFWGIFLFFYAGTYMFDKGLSLRFSLLSYAPIAIFAGLGISFIKALFEHKIKFITLILTGLVIFNAVWFLPFVRSQAKGESASCQMDHYYAMRFIRLLPENSIIFTHNPNMFLIHKQSALQTSIEALNPGKIETLIPRFRGGVYVHFNYWSGVPYDEGQRYFTEHILNIYNYEIIEEHYFKNYKFGLYKLTDRR